MDSMKLFETSGDNIIMPSVNVSESDNDSLRSDSILGAITGEKVKTLIVPENTSIDETNYVFDFSETETVSVFQKEALKALASTNGDVSLYLYKKSGLVKFGKGIQHNLERIIPLVRAHVFSNEIKVYKNFIPGEPVEEVESRDITKLRLNL